MTILLACTLLLLYFSWAKMIIYPCIVVLFMFVLREYGGIEYLNIIIFLRLAYWCWKNFTRSNPFITYFIQNFLRVLLHPTYKLSLRAEIQWALPLFSNDSPIRIQLCVFHIMHDSYIRPMWSTLPFLLYHGYAIYKKQHKAFHIFMLVYIYIYTYLFGGKEMSITRVHIENLMQRTSTPKWRAFF